MSESADYTPAPHWGGHDFKSARNTYDDNIVKVKAEAVRNDVKAVDLIPESLETDSENPVVIGCDITGSMGDWPATIFSKLPYLENELIEYYGDDFAVSFCAIGDVFSNRYPLQIQPFVKGADLKTSLGKLIVDGGGGGTSEESYDMPALYYSRKVKCPNVIHKPLFIIIGDEGVYSFIDEEKAKIYAKVEFGPRDHAKAKALILEKDTHARTIEKERITPKQVFDDLKAKYSVYIIRKPYDCSGNSSSPANTRIQRQWEELLGEERVLSLPDASRVVDVIFGILAKETGRIDYFVDELKDRQLKDKDGKSKVDVVMKSLRTLHSDTNATRKKITGPDKSGKSISTDPDVSVGRKKSISLLDD